MEKNHYLPKRADKQKLKYYLRDRYCLNNDVDNNENINISTNKIDRIKNYNDLKVIVDFLEEFNLLDILQDELYTSIYNGVCDEKTDSIIENHYINFQNNKSRNKRMKNNPVFKLRCYLASRMSSAFKNMGYNKTGKTKDLLGASFEIVKEHIEKQFIKGMSWDNKNKWHIDHIIPVSSAVTKEELIKLFHYSNLQPLWAKDNRIKYNKVPLVSQF